MSIESARKFIERVKKERGLRQSVRDAEDKAQVIRDAGFDFTMDEWQQVKKEYVGTRSENRELSDEEIKHVAAGGSCYCFQISCYCFQP